jgi:hypothetical protein
MTRKYPVFTIAEKGSVLPWEKRRRSRARLLTPPRFAVRGHLLWVGVGTDERERIKQAIETLNASLDNAKVRHGFMSGGHLTRMADVAPRLERLCPTTVPGCVT